MAAAHQRTLTPRKKPRQARSAFTLDAIFEATIQLLISDGMHRLTTTKVAERAGVSVGTMYQYFPHKEALVYSLNERYLEMLAARIESTCLARQGGPIGQMVEALIDTYRRLRVATDPGKQETFIATLRRVGHDPFKAAANAARFAQKEVA